MCDYNSLWVVMGGVLSYSLYTMQVLRTDLIFLLSAKFVYAFFLVQADCQQCVEIIAVTLQFILQNVIITATTLYIIYRNQRDPRNHVKVIVINLPFFGISVSLSVVSYWRGSTAVTTRVRSVPLSSLDRHRQWFLFIQTVASVSLCLMNSKLKQRVAQ